MACPSVLGCRARPGVLHSGSADFESVDDLVEAVGELLQEVSGDSKDDAGIRAVCQRMYNTLRLCVAGPGRAGARGLPPSLPPLTALCPHPPGPSLRARQTVKCSWTPPSSCQR